MPRIPGLTRAQHLAMERLWTQEIGGPRARFSHKTQEALLGEGLIEVNHVELPSGIAGVPVIVTVPRLSLRGHLLICEYMAEQADKEESDGQE